MPFSRDEFEAKNIPLTDEREWVPHMTILRLPEDKKESRELCNQVRAAQENFVQVKLGMDRVTVDRLRFLEFGKY